MKMNDDWSGFFDAFPNDAQYWRVDGFANLETNLQTPTEPKIGVVISPIDSSNKLPITNINSTIHTERFTTYINAGYLPYIAIGSVFKNSTLISNPSLYEYHTLELDDIFIEKNINSRIITPALNVKKNNGDTESIIPYNMYRLGGSYKSNFLAIDHKGINNKILIPSIEIGRHFYFNSTNLTRHIIWGNLNGSNKIFNPELTYIDTNDIAFLRIREDIPYSDRWVIAQFAYNSEALNRVKQIHTSSALRSINKQFISPDIYPPFDTSYKLKLRGKWIQSGDEWRFLTMWIDSSNYDFPVNTLKYDRDNDNRTDNIIDNERKKAWAYFRKRNYKNIPNSLKVRTDIEPNKDFEPLPVLLSNSRFEWMYKKQCSLLPKEECKYRNASGKSISIAIDPDSLASGDGVFNDENAAPIQFNNEAISDIETDSSLTRRPVLSSNFINIRKVVNELSIMKGATFEYIHIAQPNSTHELFDGSSYFPIFVNRKKCSWSFCNGQQRQILVFSIMFREYIFYLLEAELTEKCSATTLLISSENLCSLPKSTIEIFINNAAQHRGNWSKDTVIDGINIRKFKHRPKSKDSLKTTYILATKISNCMDLWITQHNKSLQNEGVQFG